MSSFSYPYPPAGLEDLATALEKFKKAFYDNKIGMHQAEQF